MCLWDEIFYTSSLLTKEYQQPISVNPPILLSSTDTFAKSADQDEMARNEHSH